MRRLAIWMLACGLPLLAGCKQDALLSASEAALVGSYMVDGGWDYAIIKKSAGGELAVEMSASVNESGSWDVKAKFADDGRLRILGAFSGAEWMKRIEDKQQQRELKATFENYNFSYELKPSVDIPGDWDLIGCRLPSPNAILYQRKTSETALNPPVASFFHRIDDKRVRELFELRQQGNPNFYPLATSSNDYRQLASKLAQAHPDDLFVRAHYLEALSWQRDTQALKAELTKWRAPFATAQNPLLSRDYLLAEYALHALDLAKREQSGYLFAGDLFRTKSIKIPRPNNPNAPVGDYVHFEPLNNLEKRLREFPRILEFDEYAFHQCLGVAAPNMLYYQNPLKVFRVAATFHLLQGKRAAALHLLEASWHYAQLVSDSPYYNNRLIGPLFQDVAGRGLVLYALNCTETPEDYARLRETFKRLRKRQRPLDAESFAKASFGISPHRLQAEDLLTPHQVARARFEVLRMAAAVRQYILKHGRYPEKPTDMADYFPEDPPLDPFNAKLISFKREPGLLICYSVGPDRKDDRAELVFNGSQSRGKGDIILKVPPGRQYPFPRAGVRATDAADLRRQFPDGLPRDPFSSDREGRLRIADRQPVMIYSAGPDRSFGDHSSAREVEGYVPTLTYDPTNGITSAGDLFFTVPAK